MCIRDSLHRVKKNRTVLDKILMKNINLRGKGISMTAISSTVEGKRRRGRKTLITDNDERRDYKETELNNKLGTTGLANLNAIL